MNVRTLFIGISVFIFIFLAIYFSSNMSGYQVRSNDCEVNGGFCVNSSEGCLAKEAMEHPEAQCYYDVDNKRMLDDLSVCCLKGG